MLFVSLSYPKVQQRGVTATRAVLEKLLEGMRLNDSHPVLVVDTLPNRYFGQLVFPSIISFVSALMSFFALVCIDGFPLRFSEWSSAVWEMQLAKLQASGNDTKPDWHYLSFYLSQDADLQLMQKNQSMLSGKILKGWWDACGEAGPPRRPRSTFQEAVPSLDMLSISGQVCKILCYIISNMCFSCNHT